MTSNFDYRDSHIRRGRDYQSIFSSQRDVALLWELEQEVIRDLVQEFGPFRSHLDFACGTGRITRLVSPIVGTSCGIDVSESMLEIARDAGGGELYIRVDITREEPKLGGPFDLITAFRFFPNAQPELRMEVICALAAMLSSDGTIIFNNHQARESNFERLRSLLGRSSSRTMSDQEVRGLIEAAGLRTVKEVDVGILPLGRRSIWSFGMVLRLERLLKTLTIGKGRGRYRIYVVRNSP